MQPTESDLSLPGKAAPHPSRLVRPALIAGIVLLVAFTTLYVVTLDNGLRPGELEGGDLITHQYAQVQGRFSNAPGYPLYTLGGWLWFRVGRLLLGPESNPIPILSSYSTLWALIALALLYVLLLDVTHRNWPIASLATLFYGLTYFFWYYAVTTEQYTSSVAWTLAVVLLAFRWQERRTDAFLYGLALMMGIGLAHQITVLAIAPPLLWFLLREDPRLVRRPGLLVRLVLLVALPLLSYSYVYVRGAQHPEWRGGGEWDSTLDWFLSFISTGQGRGELTWSLRTFLTPEFPSLVWGEMTWPGLIAGVAGIAALGRRRAILLYTTIAIYIVFCWIDRLGNWYQVIMPVYALLSLGIGAGAAWFLEKARAQRLPSGLVPAVVMMALAALALYRGTASYPRADSSNRPGDTALEAGRAVLADDPPPGTPILGTQNEALSLNYLTQVWGLRPDLRTITSAQARALMPHSEVGVTELALPLVPAEVAPDARYSALGRTLAMIATRPGNDIPAGISAWDYPFGDELRLAGGLMKPNHATGEQVVLLSWLAQARPTRDWSVSVRLLEDGREIGQADREHPVHGAYPMTRWLPGEVVNDAYAFKLPTGAKPDQVAVILYRQEAGEFQNLAEARFAIGDQTEGPEDPPPGE